MAERQRVGDDKELTLLPCFGGETKRSLAEQLLQQRVEALEERLEQMRLSRRVLMRILEQAEQDKQVELGNLRRENERLRRQNSLLARSAWEGNVRLVRMLHQCEQEI